MVDTIFIFCEETKVDVSHFPMSAFRKSFRINFSLGRMFWILFFKKMVFVTTTNLKFDSTKLK